MSVGLVSDTRTLFLHEPTDDGFWDSCSLRTASGGWLSASRPPKTSIGETELTVRRVLDVAAANYRAVRTNQSGAHAALLAEALRELRR
jgi:N-methylhydantoinase B/oxoprolinase/acetone carboxylase alpha subunit